MVSPSSWQSRAKSRARSTVAPFLMFFRICGSPDSKPTISSRQPASRIAFSVSRSVVTREVQDHVSFSGLSLAQSSTVRAFWMLKEKAAEEKLLCVGEQLLGGGHLCRHIVGRALAPCVSTQSLRPQAEGALRRAAARGIQRDIRIQQERNVVFRYIDVAFIDIGHPRHLVQVIHLC